MHRSNSWVGWIELYGRQMSFFLISWSEVRKTVSIDCLLLVDTSMSIYKQCTSIKSPNLLWKNISDTIDFDDTWEYLVSLHPRRRRGRILFKLVSSCLLGENPSINIGRQHYQRTLISVFMYEVHLKDSSMFLSRKHPFQCLSGLISFVCLSNFFFIF